MGSGGGGGVPTITGSGVRGGAGFCNSANTARGIAGETTGGTVGSVAVICTMP